MGPRSRLIGRSSPALCAIIVVVLAFIAGSLAAKAQPAERVYRLGFLGQTSAASLARQIAALRQGLRDLGYEEGRNLLIESLGRVETRSLASAGV